MSTYSCKPCDYRTDFDKRFITTVSGWVLARDTDPLHPLPETYKKMRENYTYKYLNEITGYENNTIQTRASCPCAGKMSLPHDTVDERFSYI